MQPKKINIISNVNQILEPIKISIFKESNLYEIYLDIKNSLEEAIAKYTNSKKIELNYDLYIFYFDQLGKDIEFEDYHKRIENLYSVINAKILIVLGNERDVLRFSTFKSEKYKFITTTDFYRSKSIDIIDAYLGIQEDDLDTTIISNFNIERDEKLFKVIDSKRLKLSDRLRTSHLFANKKSFSLVHVQYNSENTISYEENSDYFIDQDFKSNYVEAHESFYNVYTNPERITHFIIGHRGSGKSCFIRDFFENYLSDKFPEQPYVTVDFLRFGFYPTDDSINAKIIDALYKHFTNPSNIILELYRRYQIINDLFPNEEVISVIEYYAKNYDKYDFNEVFSYEIQYKIENEIGRLDKIEIAKELFLKYNNVIQELIGHHEGITLNTIDEDDLIEVYKYFSTKKEQQWHWLKCLWRYICKYTNEKPLRFFLETMLNNAYSNDINEYGASSKLFQSNEAMQQWKRDNFNNEISNISTLSEPQLVDRINSFIKATIKNLGFIHVILDNIDQLHAPIAEYTLYHKITEVIKTYNPRAIKYIVSMRPSTIEALKEDVAAYKKFWLKTVDLKIVLENRIKVLLSDSELTRDEVNFLINLKEILNLPVAISQNAIKSKHNLSFLISQLCGNNLREGKELFAEMVDNWYDNFNIVGKFGFLREKYERGHKRKYIAEHIALRSLFLDNTKHYKFRNHLINVFETPGLNGYAGVLIQLRILEILDKYVECKWIKIFEYLQLLAYKNDEIIIAISHLKDFRLLSTKPFHTNLDLTDTNTSVYIRHRGTSYLSFIRKLSYIQLVYFMTELPSTYSKKFSYPNAPTPLELKELSENFLHSIEKFISVELNHTTKTNISIYENKVRPVNQILKDISDIQFDLHNILRY
jgi:hypothetical protein